MRHIRQPVPVQSDPLKGWRRFAHIPELWSLDKGRFERVVFVPGLWDIDDGCNLFLSFPGTGHGG